jgi:hypothetical protein
MINIKNSLIKNPDYVRYRLIYKRYKMPGSDDI